MHNFEISLQYLIILRLKKSSLSTCQLKMTISVIKGIIIRVTIAQYEA